ncbi:hypothetical protein [Dyadobacter sp. NIV53]|uniref:hypothetical protein n=1 Tax=Dyadobacter sp. NIV53 TaxID=2861765 RepID=UPI001C88AAB5|nr:hypothetical protein [Dyadobacter sp. NIV53]
MNNLDLKFNIVKVSSSEGSSNIKTFDDVRIVMIPGRVRLSAGTNWNKYEETIQALGLSEKDVKIFK